MEVCDLTEDIEENTLLSHHVLEIDVAHRPADFVGIQAQMYSNLRGIP
jgi:hypothetical protein